MAITPVSVSNSNSSNWNTVNDAIRQLNNEQTTKVFKGTGQTNSIIEGKLPYDGGRGTLYYDTDGTPRIVIGIQPDGTVGLTISKPGESVLEVFS